MNGSSVFDQEQLLFPLVWKCVHFYNFIIYQWMFVALSRATYCLQQHHVKIERSGARNSKNIFPFCFSLGILVCNAYMCTYMYKPHSIPFTGACVVYRCGCTNDSIPLTDDGGRYAYDRQPSICRWNLQKLAEALASCLPPEKAKEGLSL